jgi:hypothetical protein
MHMPGGAGHDQFDGGYFTRAGRTFSPVRCSSDKLRLSAGADRLPSAEIMCPNSIGMIVKLQHSAQACCFGSRPTNCPVDNQLFLICFLTFVIHLIGTLAYSVRIAGVRTRRIAVSFALFSVLVLVSRTSNSFLGPFLAKRVESNLDLLARNALLSDFRWLLVSASLATIVGAFLIPTFQRVFCRAVIHFQVHRSIPKMILHGFFKGGLTYIKDVASVPAAKNMTGIRSGHGVSTRITLLNIAATALWTVGVFASLYAGVLDPSVRVTSSTLSSIINGGATIMLAVFIDPHMSGMTDDVIEGTVSEAQFRKAIVWLVGSRLAGTLLAQALLVPAAMLIAWVAGVI